MTKYDEISELLMSIASRKRDTNQMKAQIELKTIQREYESYTDGVLDALKAIKQAMPMDNLLTANDLDTIARAHRHCREMEIERTLGVLRVRVSTCPATRAWSAPYLIRLERWRPGMYSTQYFDSAEALREEIANEFQQRLQRGV